MYGVELLMQGGIGSRWTVRRKMQASRPGDYTSPITPVSWKPQSVRPSTKQCRASSKAAQKAAASVSSSSSPYYVATREFAEY